MAAGERPLVEKTYDRALLRLCSSQPRSRSTERGNEFASIHAPSPNLETSVAHDNLERFPASLNRFLPKGVP